MDKDDMMELILIIDYDIRGILGFINFNYKRKDIRIKYIHDRLMDIRKRINDKHEYVYRFRRLENEQGNKDIMD